jgi:hypothetical protein
MLLFGVFLVRDASVAHAQHSFIPSKGPKAPWMTPFQGYTAGFLCAGFGVYLLVLGLGGAKR